VGFLSFLKKKGSSSDTLPQSTQSSQEKGLPPNPQERTSPKHPAAPFSSKEEEPEIPSLEETRHVDDFGVLPDISELEVPAPPSEEEIRAETEEKVEVKIPEMTDDEIPDTLPDLEEKRIEEKVEMELREASGPLFVASHAFNAMNAGIGSIKINLKTSEEILSSMDEIRMRQDSAYEKWARLLENIERKLVYVDKSLFE
ncbi:hypothetical protein KY339_05650, partial [Candidatus Woesearchaeota archaeon]|nr:hypothetical protein [Candidatus Woesearchaeota archaeon]